MQVGLYPHGENQSQGYLLNVNYFPLSSQNKNIQAHPSPFPLPPSPFPLPPAVYHGAGYKFACTSELNF